MLCIAVLKEGGCILAPVMEEDGTVRHQFVEKEDDLRPALGAKYVQSSFSSMLEALKERLKSGDKVLFSGTPCQTAAVKQYLKTDYENLLLVDIICHGVPKAELWKGYLDALQSYYKRDIQRVNFRDRTEGWKNYRFTVELGDRVYSNYPGNDFYMTAFLRNYSLMDGCYHCRHKGENRVSDITLGDFWGAEKVLPPAEVGKGVTLVISRTEKGQAWLEKFAEDTLQREIPYEKALNENPSYFNAASCPADRDKFLSRFMKKTFTLQDARNYFPRSWKQKLHQVIKNRQFQKRRKVK